MAKIRCNLEGGSVINSAFQQNSCIDELSLVVAPLTAATEDKPLFETGQMRHYQLMDTRVLDTNTIWMRYKKR